MKRKLTLIFTIAMMATLSLTTFAKPAKKGPLSPATLNERIYQYRQLLSLLQNQYVDSLDMEAVIAAGITSMLNTVDPYTEFYNPETLEELTTVTSGMYGGIGSGILLRDSVIVLSDPYYGKPAAMAGVRHGDIILQIDDYVLPKTGLNTSDISAKLRGNPGTHVKVKVRRPWINDGSDSIFVFDIERAKVSIDPVPFTTVFDDGIAYVEVSTFNQNTADEIHDAVAKIKARHGSALKGIIIDLRDNGGGLLESAVNLLSIFLDRGTKVVETRYRDGSNSVYKTRKSPVDTKIPLLVMVNGNTASASEIVSGAIQDLDRGVIMGRRTFGKGLVQTSGSLGFGSVLKYTSGKYYLPSGRLVQALDYRDAEGKATLIPDSLTHEYRTANGRLVRDGRGISPDIEVKALTASQLAWQLYRDQWVDDFANRYRNTHAEAPDLRDQAVTDKIYGEFMDFVNPDKLQFGSASRNGIKFLREAVEVEGLQTDSITQAIDNLEKMLQHDLRTELEANRREIGELLELAIAERYYTPDEVSAIVISKDNDVFEARKLLKDTNRYRELLLPKDKAPSNKAVSATDSGKD